MEGAFTFRGELGIGMKSPIPISPPEPLAGRRTVSAQSLLEVFGVALRLGLTSFGGPIAHLGYFRAEYVERRKWLDDKAYADLVALCQFLPGPASSQVGIAVGMSRAGLLGGIAAWIGFTMPSALALILFSALLQDADIAQAGWLHGLLVAAVAVVAHALWGMATKLTPDRPRVTMALLTAIVALGLPTALVQVVLVAAAGLLGWIFLKAPEADVEQAVTVPISRRIAWAAWALMGVLLIGLPILRQVAPVQWLELTDSLFRVGSLVFGGGHVVLPLLNAEVVASGWLSDTQFVAGYGAAQAVPGPLFTFAAYIGAAMGGVGLGLLATMAIFLPSFLLVTGALPFWDEIRRRASFQAALRGINAAVVGILLAALYDPIWTKAILGPADFGLALAAFGLLMFWRVPPWAVVVFCAFGGAVIRPFG